MLVILVLTIAFGQSDGSSIQSFYFVSLLLPVIVGLNYFFNYLLLPKYLLARRYWLFGLYSFYTLIISLYLETIVLFVAFILLANYNFNNLNPATTNIFLLCIVLYGVVFLNTVMILVRKNLGGELDADRKKSFDITSTGSLIIRADRKNHKIMYDDILYLESLNDYVRITLISDQVIVTKEKISKFEKSLPISFQRIHRSFIVNLSKVESFNREMVFVKGEQLPISRSYKKETNQRLNKSIANERPTSTSVDNL